MSWLSLLIAMSAQVAGLPEAETLDVTFSGVDGGVFEARVVVPPPEERNGVGVLMLGGGIANDLDWSVPGRLEMGDRTVQLTISGETHRDAPRLAAALAARGYVVMHWSTIARDDPKRDRWPYEVTSYSMPQLVELTIAALERLRALELVAADRIVLLGHSMGGHRACCLALRDDGIAGLVLTGSAQLTRTTPDDDGRAMHRAAAIAALRVMDGDGDGLASATELTAWRAERGRDHALAATEFVTLDFDHDGQLRVWELAAGMALVARQDLELPPMPGLDRFGLPWSEDVLAVRPVPTLVLYGVLDDAQGHHAPVIARRIEEAPLRHVDLVLLPRLGHQLAPERGGRTGPIDDAALQAIGTWLDRALP
jgi:pimeloyl-ACP methyl ester carboxylesterase